jgi:hypothetical protein
MPAIYNVKLRLGSSAFQAFISIHQPVLSGCKYQRAMKAPQVVSINSYAFAIGQDFRIREDAPSWGSTHISAKHSPLLPSPL